jgi:hypothetical protein
LFRVRRHALGKHAIASDAAVDLAGGTPPGRAARRHAALAVDLPMSRNGGVLSHGCGGWGVSDGRGLRERDAVDCEQSRGRKADGKSLFHVAFPFLVLGGINGLEVGLFRQQPLSLRGDPVLVTEPEGIDRSACCFRIF